MENFQLAPLLTVALRDGSFRITLKNAQTGFTQVATGASNHLWIPYKEDLTNEYNSGLDIVAAYNSVEVDVYGRVIPSTNGALVWSRKSCDFDLSEVDVFVLDLLKEDANSKRIANLWRVMEMCPQLSVPKFKQSVIDLERCGKITKVKGSTWNYKINHQ